MTLTLLGTVSNALGWTYSICWSLSFYPQLILNSTRRSTAGTTIDFPVLNAFGFIAYFISTATSLYSPRLRHEYALRNHGLTPTVQLNDLAFAGHAVLLTSLTLSQYIPGLWHIDMRGRSAVSRISKGILAVVVGSLVAVASVIATVAAEQDQDARRGWALIDIIYTISYVKVIVTVIKYCPQVLLNYRNKSTHGWSITMIVLDCAGGVLSLAQLLTDSYLLRDWSGITGNPVKLALGNISIAFDCTFVTQHCYLYRDSNKRFVPENEVEPLLNNIEHD